METAEFTLNMALKINKSSKLSPPKRPYFQNINFRDQPKSNTSSDSEEQNTSTNTKINIKLNPNVVEITNHETVETTPSLNTVNMLSVKRKVI